MQVSSEELSELRRTIKVVLPKELVQKRMGAEYKKLKNSASLKGFRKGKVPQTVLEKTYGEQVKAEVSEKLIQDTYFDALEETKIEAVVHPDIRSFNFAEDGTFVYNAEIETKPVFELNEYKGITVEHSKVVVSEEEVERSLELTRKEMAPLRAVDDRGAQQDDIVIIDFQGCDEEGKEIPQIAGTEYSVDIGSGRNGKDFEEMLIGLKNGEEAEKTVTFPADIANPMLAGNTILFKLTVKDIKERVLPEIDDEFAQDIGEEFTTLDDLKESIREKLLKEKNQAIEGDISDKIMMQILESHEFPLPGRLVAFEIDALVKELESNLERQGLTLETAGLNREKLAEQYKESAEKRVKGEFILKKIAEVEGVKIEEEDINQGFARIADQYGMPVEQVKQYFQNRNDMLPFMNELLSEKILKFIRSEAQVTFVEPSEGPQEEAAGE